MKCTRCHDTQRVNEARQSVPCPDCCARYTTEPQETPEWIYAAAAECAQLEASELFEPLAVGVIERHWRNSLGE